MTQRITQRALSVYKSRNFLTPLDFFFAEKVLLSLQWNFQKF
jgi:hypothetical protein